MLYTLRDSVVCAVATWLVGFASLAGVSAQPCVEDDASASGSSVEQDAVPADDEHVLPPSDSESALIRVGNQCRAESADRLFAALGEDAPPLLPDVPLRMWRAELNGSAPSEAVLVARSPGGVSPHSWIAETARSTDHLWVFECTGAWRVVGYKAFDATLDASVELEEGETYQPGIIDIDTDSYRVPTGQRILVVTDEQGQGGADPRFYMRQVSWLVLTPDGLRRVFGALLQSDLQSGPARSGGRSERHIEQGARRFRIRVRWQSWPYLDYEDEDDQRRACSGRRVYEWNQERYVPLPSNRAECAEY